MLTIKTRPTLLAEFPALKAFFTFEEDANAAFTDVVNPTVAGNFTTATNAVPYSITNTSATPAAPTGAYSSDPMTSSIVMHCVVDTNANPVSIAFGNFTSAGSYFLTSNSSSSITDSGDTTTNISLSVGVTGATTEFALIVDINAGTIKVYDDSVATSTLAQISDASVAVPGTWAGFDLGDCTDALILATSGSSFYSWSIFEFTTVPSDILTYLNWMNTQHRAGNKVIHPSLKGVS